MFKQYGLVRSLLGESHVYENGTDRWRVWIGDLARWNEDQSGGRMGGQLTFEIGFGDYLGDFDQDADYIKVDGKVKRVPYADGKHEYLTRWITIMIGRYGITLNLRGRRIDGTDWDTPRWKLGRNGELLEEWR